MKEKKELIDKCYYTQNRDSVPKIIDSKCLLVLIEVLIDIRDVLTNK